MSFAPTGTVYGTLLNFRAEWDAFAPQMHAAPYTAPPRAPVLYVKTANTFSANGAAVALPPSAEVEVGATLAVVMGAGGAVRGHLLVNDLSLPHASYFRPPVKFRNRDGFLGLGDTVAPVDVAGIAIEVRVNDALVQTVRFDALVREPARLLADVTEFMTLGESDLLLLGLPYPRPRARAGDRITLAAPGLGTLANTLVEEAA